MLAEVTCILPVKDMARARRFYERRGWTVTGEEWSEDLTLMLTEYRLVLA